MDTPKLNIDPPMDTNAMIIAVEISFSLGNIGSDIGNV